MQLEDLEGHVEVLVFPKTYARYGQQLDADTVTLVSGRLDSDEVLDNMRRRPDSEHRRLINRGILDLIERALSTSVEELPDDAIEMFYWQAE